MAFDLAVTLGFWVVSFLALLVFLLFGKLIRPNIPLPVKSSTYECGERPVGSGWFSFNNRFYIIALVFVVFDVEIALVAPVVVVFRELVDSDQGWLAFVEIFLFLSVLFIALVYVWSRGDLRWHQDIQDPTCNPLGSETKKEVDR